MEKNLLTMDSKTIFLNNNNSGKNSKNLSIIFEDIWLTVKYHKGYKKIIKGISGKFKSGELTAIMGPSGAGKTSLLNILTGYQKSGVNGVIKSQHGSEIKSGINQYQSKSSYILQDDYLLSYFTVNEIMNSTVRLKINGLTQKEINNLVCKILKTLHLIDIKNTLCGTLSGGQRKRLSIALELIDDPPILFLDEPTTGLDSNSCRQCIEMLKSLAEKGRTIICTIHQPSAPIYHTFSHVYFMANGKCVYQGSPQNTLPFLGLHGFICPKYHNPADFILEVAISQNGNNIDKMAQTVKDNFWHHRTDEITDLNLISIKKNMEIIENNALIKVNRPSELTRFFILLHKQIIFLYRDWSAAKLKILLNFLTGILVGVIFQNSGNDASRTIENCSLMFVSMIYLLYTSLMPAVLRFPCKVKIIKKEYFNRWYKIRTFYIAYLLIDIPLQILFAISFNIGLYVISAQPLEYNRFFMVLFIHSLIGIVSAGAGTMFGTILKPVNGTFIGAVSAAGFYLLAGYACFLPHMNKFFYFMTNFSFLSFSFDALLQALYAFNRTSIECPESIEYCLYTDPNELLKDLGMNKTSYWMNVVWILINALLFRIAAYCALLWKVKVI